MHKVFGTKENEKFVDRKGAYIIPIKGDEVGVVETPKGFFLLEKKTYKEVKINEKIPSPNKIQKGLGKFISAKYLSITPVKVINIRWSRFKKNTCENSI